MIFKKLYLTHLYIDNKSGLSASFQKVAHVLVSGSEQPNTRVGDDDLIAFLQYSVNIPENIT